MRKLFIAMAIAVCGVSTVYGQALGRHTYCHVDIKTSNNTWAILGSSVATNVANVLTHSNIFENSIEFDSKSGKTSDEKMGFKEYNKTSILWGASSFKAHDLFQTIQPSLKIGYISSLPDDFNWGVYAVGSYRYNQFQVSPVKSDDVYSKQELQRCLLGGSLFAVIGGVSKSLHVMIEAGARYNIGIGAKGVLGDKDAFNDGITSHYAVKLTGSRMTQDFGIFVDVDHFDYLKSDVQKMHRWSIGLTYCLTFGQAMYGVQ